jgi:hypothetical protein
MKSLLIAATSLVLLGSFAVAQETERKREHRSKTHQESRAHRMDWDGIKKRVEGAVERGDLTREEANAKYKAIKERIAASHGGQAKHAKAKGNSDQKLEERYQKLLKEKPDLAHMPKERVMARLRASEQGPARQRKRAQAATPKKRGEKAHDARRSDARSHGPQDRPPLRGPQGALKKKLGELVQAKKLTHIEAADLFHTAYPSPPRRQAQLGPRPGGPQMDRSSRRSHAQDAGRTPGAKPKGHDQTVARIHKHLEELRKSIAEAHKAINELQADREHEEEEDHDDDDEEDDDDDDRRPRRERGGKR